MLFNKMSICWLGSLMLLSFNAFANLKPIANFDELLQALDSGSKVRGVIYLDNCKLESGGGFPKTMSVGFTYDYFLHYNLPIDNNHTVEVITTSKDVFTITKVNDLGPINNYLQIHVLKNNTAHVFGALLDPKNYDQKISVNYTCPMGTNPIQAGLMLFNPDA